MKIPNPKKKSFAAEVTRKHFTIDDIPIILFGDMWPELIAWTERRPRRHKLVSPGDFDNLFLTDQMEEVPAIIEAAHGAFLLGEKHSCKELKQKMGYSLEQRLK